MGISEALLPRLFIGRELREKARLDEICDLAPGGEKVAELVLWIVRVVEWVRPRQGHTAQTRVRFFRAHLDAQPARRARVAAALDALAKHVDVETFLAYGGIARDFHLLGAISQWLTSRILPTPCRTDDVEQIICLALRERDLRWMRSSGFVSFLFDLAAPDVTARFTTSAHEAARHLVHQIVAQAHAPSLRKLASGRSPFRGLFEAVAAFVEDPKNDSHYKSVRGRIVQCESAREDLRGHLAERGADLNTTFQLMRIEQQLRRLDVLTVALHDGSEASARAAITLVRASLRNAHANHIVRRSSELVIQNLVDTTADVGDHYLDRRSSSLRASFLAGCGGGVLMVVATYLKFGIGSLHLPASYEGLVFAANYAAAFCAAYLLHYTIATKLPAHTAAALARSIDGDLPRRRRVAAFAEALRSLVRLQIGGLVGNIVIVAPAAFAIAWAFRFRFHHAIVMPDHALHALESNSVLGPSALYAALTGVFLWISSLVGAAVDNWSRANHLEASLATGTRVMKTIGARRAAPFARAISKRLGGFVGNAFLGFLLGFVPAFFALWKLPIEIRHVTVSTGSVGLAIGSGVGTRPQIIEAIIGVAVIGLVNIGVSFALALRLALRASHDSPQKRVLVKVGLRRALSLRDPQGKISRSL